MKKLIIAIIPVFTLFSCSKSSNNPSGNNSNGGNSNNPTTIKSCKIFQLVLSTDFSLSQGAIDETDVVTYTGDQLTSISIQTPGHQLNGSKTDFVYNGSKLIRINYAYKLNGGAPSGNFDSIFYDANGKISTIKEFNHDGSNQGSVKYTYSGSLLTKKEFSNGGIITYHTYEYNSSNLISKVHRFNSSGQEYDNITYAYGSKENRLFKDNNMLDVYFHTGYDGDEDLIYEGLLNNAVLPEQITQTVAGQQPKSFTLTYSLNSNGYPEQVLSNNKVIITNQFNCN